MNNADKDGSWSSSNHTKIELKVIELIHQNSKFLFDQEYYLEQNQDIASIGMDPLVYHVVAGWKRGGNTSAEKGFFKRFLKAYRENFFNEEYYLQTNPEIVSTGVEPFYHYIVKGYTQNRRPNSLAPVERDGRLVQLLALNYICIPYYLDKYPEIKRGKEHPIMHYLYDGINQGYFPNGEHDCAENEAELRSILPSAADIVLQDGAAGNLREQILLVYAAFCRDYTDKPEIGIVETDVFAIHPEILAKSYNQLNKVYSLLADAESKNVYAAVVLARLINRNEVYAYIMSAYKQYHHPLVKPEVDEVVIDLGACEGYTSIAPLSSTGGRATVYSLEPGKAAYQNVLSNIEKFQYKDRIHTFNLGSWSEKARLYFSDEDANGSSRVVNYKTDFYIDVIDVDSLVSENNIENVTLIKMDVEGSEMETLKGADKTLKRFRPKLQVSIYHKNYSDLLDIPSYLDNLNLGYNFYVGHHSTCFGETVLYAVAQ